MNKNYLAVLLLGTCVSTQALAGFTDIHEDPLMDLEMKRTAYKTQLEKDEAMTVIWNNQLSSLYFDIDDKEQKLAIKALRSAFNERLARREEKVAFFQEIYEKQAEKDKRIKNLEIAIQENSDCRQEELENIATLHKDIERTGAELNSIQSKIDQIEIEITKDEDLTPDNRAKKIAEKTKLLKEEHTLKREAHEKHVKEKLEKERHIKELEVEGERLDKDKRVATSAEILSKKMKNSLMFGVHQHYQKLKVEDHNETAKTQWLNHIKAKIGVYEAIQMLTEKFHHYFSDSIPPSLANILVTSMEKEGNAQIEKQISHDRTKYNENKTEQLDKAIEHANVAYENTVLNSEKKVTKANEEIVGSKWYISRFMSYEPFSSVKINPSSFNPNALLQKELGEEVNLQKFALKNLAKWKEREEKVVKASQDNFKKFVFIMQNISGKDLKSEQGQDKNPNPNRNM